VYPQIASTGITRRQNCNRLTNLYSCEGSAATDGVWSLIVEPFCAVGVFGHQADAIPRSIGIAAARSRDRVALVRLL
jgi:hypothetical protein